MRKLSGESLNITEENLAKLKQLFPEAFTEGKIDFDVLRQLLGDYVDDEEERYSFKWNGKGKALRLSQTPSLGTLRPCKEESKDWDTTQNLYIEGDNLEVLKLLQKSYYGKVKMIYIDPPYNTGNDFVYKDDFRDNIENYKRVTGQVDGEGHKIDTNTESNGRFHTDWLNMMYPRLRLARNLLAEDGAIFIHIDENEISNLSTICSEIFGSNNELGIIVWDKRNPKGTVAGVAYQHEYIVVIGKDRNDFKNAIFCQRKENAHRMIKKVEALIKKNNGMVNNSVREQYKAWLNENEDKFSGGEKAYKLIDAAGRIYQPVSMAAPDKPETRSHRPLIHPVTGKECPVPGKGWRFKDDTMKLLKEQNKIEFGKDESVQPRQKYFLDENMEESVSSLLYFGGDGDGDILGLNFDNPKPVYVAKRIIYSLCKGSEEIILDFFSGSATTAHAVMQLNAEDSGNRKFIMVQLPEPISEDSEAAKAGYKNICEIGKERIRRAGEKIKAEAGENAEKLDVGFKVFKLDSSNLQKWNPQLKALELALQESIENFLPGRTELDVVYEILLKMGLDLSTPIEERAAAGEKVYIVGYGALMICLGKNITVAVAEEIVKLHKKYDSKLWQMVFRDNGFASDKDKTNIRETLKAAGLDEDSFVCV